jgi:hypothetical protein
MQRRGGHGSSTGRLVFAAAHLRRRVRPAGLAIVGASLWLLLCTPTALAKGSAQGPPAGPKSQPFTQCPAIGADKSCEYLIDVTSTDPAVLPTVIQDPTQHFYDGEDDVTVGIQNDTTAPLRFIHVGVEGSGDHLFALDGDGLCWSALPGPKPAECPFSASSYAGPDTELSPQSRDRGTVSFPTPLKPGQYTYFALEAPPSEGIVAGEVDNVVSTTLTNTQTGQTGDSLSAPAPVPVIDQATIKGANGFKPTGTVEYLLYSDSNCQRLVERLGTKPVEAGVAQPSLPSSRALHTNATYYWIAKYSGDTHHSTNASVCGSETMMFGTPPGPGGSQPGASSQFNFVGHPRVNEKTGQITITVQLPGAGLATARAALKQGAALARAGAASKKKCRRGLVTRHGRCTGGASAAFGTGALNAPIAGTYAIVIKPTKRVLAALKKGKKLNVTVSVTFQNRAGGAAVTHAQSVLVKLKRPGHRRR